MSPRSSPWSPATGRYSGATASPNASRQARMASSKSARWWSSLVITTARGMPTSAHSSQIGVDEIQYAKGHKYLTLVYQIDIGITRLLWIGKERTIESFQ